MVQVARIRFRNGFRRETVLWLAVPLPEWGRAPLH